MSHTFKAKYDGRCPACTQVIEEGDLLERDADDRVVHSDCVYRPSDLRTQYGKPCPRCYQIPSKSGACGCDPEDQEARP